MKLSIIGASGHGKVVAEAAVLSGYQEIEFLDDNPALTSCGKYPVTGASEDCSGKDNDIFIGIGSGRIRKKMMEQYTDKNIPVICHPHAVVSDTARIGRGTVIMAGAVINADAVIGQGCIINTCSSVDHECILGDYVHVAVGAHLCGNVSVGNETWIGAGAIVINNVRICGGCMIGAGAVVVEDISEPGTYIGVPARRMN